MCSKVEIEISPLAYELAGLLAASINPCLTVDELVEYLIVLQAEQEGLEPAEPSA
jgi:hypothetical protein